MREGAGPLVEVIVVNYNNLEDTSECLASLKRLDYRNLRITVVDNGSTDGSGGRLAEEFPEVDLVFSRENLGYAGGNNLGMTRALERGAELVWLLNNDAVAERESLSALVRAALEHPEAGILGSLVCSDREPHEPESFGGKRTRHRLRPRTRWPRAGEVRDPVETDFVTGASLMARAETIRQVGLLEPSFFLYYEDTDWCLRARRRGWKVLLVPSSRVLHKRGSTTLRDKPAMIYYVCRNSLLCCSRNFPGWLPVLLPSCFRRFFLNYLGRYMIKGFERTELECALMGLRGIADFLRGRFGRLEERGRAPAK